MEEPFTIKHRRSLSTMGIPDETGNVYALDRQGKPFIAYNTRGTGPMGVSPLNPVSGANATIYSQGGSLLEPAAGKKRLRDYYKMLMGME